MAHSPLDKIQALDAIEKEIITCVQSAGEILYQQTKKSLFFSNLCVKLSKYIKII